MHAAGDHLLAATVLAGDQNVGVRRTDAGNQLQHGFHSRGRGNEVRGLSRQEGRILGLEPETATQCPAQGNLVAEDRQKSVVVPRFLDEITRSEANGLDRDFDASPRCHHNHRKRTVDALELSQQFQTFRPGCCVPRIVEGR